MKIKNLFLGFVAAALLSSCAITTPYLVTENSIGTKKGVSTSWALAYVPGYQDGLILNRNLGVVEAAKNGKITKIGCVDKKVTSYVLIHKVEYVVSGE